MCIDLVVLIVPCSNRQQCQQGQGCKGDLRVNRERTLYQTQSDTFVNLPTQLIL